MHSVLSKHQGGKAAFSKAVSLPDPVKFALTACIVALSSLASRYLLQLLAENASIHSVLLEEFVEDPADPQSTVFILDASSLSLPLGECMRRLQIRFAGAKYLVIDKTKTVHQIAKLLQLGVHGYLTDYRVAQELQEAARSVVEGKLWIADDVLQQYVILTTASNRARMQKGLSPTAREIQILELVQQRFSNKEIAEMFNIQESTVKFHLTNIFGKMQVMNRRELAGRGSFSDVWERLLKCKLPAPVVRCKKRVLQPSPDIQTLPIPDYRMPDLTL